ncbi:MAG: sulfatase-like hydrolase/transferase [bacterium]|nr:sulfatase-like hydrolase/transferase [bacterium]
MKRKNNIIKIAVAGIAVIVIVYLFFGTGIILNHGEARLKDLNVILITIDTLRADYLSCYSEGNAPKARTPHLDQLAREGVLFERCIAQAPLTLPSHATILSGTYPTYHGVKDNGGYRVPGELELVSEVLKKNGYATAAFIGAYVLHSKWGMDQGFDTYFDDFDVTGYRNTGAEVEKRADEVLENAARWLQAHLRTGREKKFFTWIHLFDPHAPYEAPAPYEKGYRGEVEYTDQQLGRFFRFLEQNGLFERTLVIVTSDHGEGLGEHDEPTHGLFVYETTVRVPLIFRAPVQFPGKRVKYGNIVELADLAPTILDALDIPAPDSYQGRSLLNLMLGKKHAKRNTAYTEAYYSRLHFGWSELNALYHDRWKYIQAPRAQGASAASAEELYDIQKNSAETEDMILENDAERRKLKKRLRDFTRQKSVNALVPGRVAKISKKDAGKLASLGYLTGTMDTAGKQNLPHPRHKIDFVNDFSTARQWLGRGRIDDAVRLLKELAAKEPDNVDCLLVLGDAYRAAAMHRESYRCFQRVLRLRPDYNDAMINIIHALTSLGETDAAIEEAGKFLKIFPNDYSLHNQLGAVYFSKSDYQMALEWYQKSADLEPADSAALGRIGEIHVINENYDKAEPFLKKALILNPLIRRTHYYLGQVEKNRGNETAAAAHFRKEIAVNPGFKMPYFVVAEYLMRNQKNLEEALQLCKKGLAIEPEDEASLFGYYVITNIYGKLGADANFKYYSAKGEQLYKKIKGSRD